MYFKYRFHLLINKIEELVFLVKAPKNESIVLFCFNYLPSPPYVVNICISDGNSGHVDPLKRNFRQGSGTMIRNTVKTKLLTMEKLLNDPGTGQSPDEILGMKETEIYYLFHPETILTKTADQPKTTMPTWLGTSFTTEPTSLSAKIKSGLKPPVGSVLTSRQKIWPLN